MNWEYVILSDPRVGNQVTIEPTTTKLNELGAQGWELVAAFPTNMLGETVTVMYVLKRAKAST